MSNTDLMVFLLGGYLSFFWIILLLGSNKSVYVEILVHPCLVADEQNIKVGKASSDTNEQTHDER